MHSSGRHDKGKTNLRHLIISVHFATNNEFYCTVNAIDNLAVGYKKTWHSVYDIRVTHGLPLMPVEGYFLTLQACEEYNLRVGGTIHAER